MKNIKTEYADVLIIGSGLAGLLLAVRLLAGGENPRRVVLVSKGSLGQSNSAWAQGGVAAVTGVNPFDSPELHLADTLKSGAGLADAAVAAEIIYGGKRLVDALDACGVAFDKTAGGASALALEGGHRQPRVLHSKDTTGLSIVEALTAVIKRAEAEGKIVVYENTLATALGSLDGLPGAPCTGARLISDEGGSIDLVATYTVLATGGIGQVFERTTNPIVATGDGIALACRAGARLADMEFVQFHPTALRLDGAPAFLISEAVRGAGAILVDSLGRRFVGRFHEDAELATRDVVSRAIHTVMTEHNQSHVFLDLRPIVSGGEKAAAKGTLAERFPHIVKTCADYGLDVNSAAIPVAPAAHYMMGGIAADTSGRTSVDRLFAIGECACTGLHGANRLASNSLLEAGVMALNLADLILSEKEPGFSKQRPDARGLRFAPAPLLVPVDFEAFRILMYRQAGLVRNAAGLASIEAWRFVDKGRCEDNHSFPDFNAASILLVGRAIAAAALAREVSVGSHYRDDCRFGGAGEASVIIAENQ